MNKFFQLNFSYKNVKSSSNDTNKTLVVSVPDLYTSSNTQYTNTVKYYKNKFKEYNNDNNLFDNFTDNLEVIDIEEWYKIIKIKNKNNISQLKNIIYYNLILIGSPVELRISIINLLTTYFHNTQIIKNLIIKKYNKEDTDSKVQILKDIPRTKLPLKFIKDCNINKEIYIDILKSVLISYSNYFKDIGYIQGINIIASYIIFNVLISMPNKPIKDIEETSFNIIVSIFSNYNFNLICKGNLEYIYVLIDKLKLKLLKKDLKIYSLLKNSGFEFYTFFITFYFTVTFEFIDFEDSAFILELIFLFGYKIINKLILSALMFQRNTLLKQKDNEEILIYIKSQLFIDCYKNLTNYRSFFYKEVNIKKYLN